MTKQESNRGNNPSELRDETESSSRPLGGCADVATILGTAVAVVSVIIALIALVPPFYNFSKSLRSDGEPISTLDADSSPTSVEKPTAEASPFALTSSPTVGEPTIYTPRASEPPREATASPTHTATPLPSHTPTDSPTPTSTPQPVEGTWSLVDSFDDGCVSAAFWGPEQGGPASSSCLDLTAAGLREGDEALKIRADHGGTVAGEKEFHIMATLSMQVQRAEIDVKLYQHQDGAFNSVRLKGSAGNDFIFGLRDEGMGHTKASSYEAGVGPVFDSTLYPFEEVITLGGWLDESAELIHLYVNDRDNVVSTVSARGGWSELGVGYYLSPDTPSTVQADVLEYRIQYVDADSGGI